MECIDYDDLDEQREIFDAEVRVSPHVDGFCASTDWILPAARGLEAGRRPWIWRGTHGWVALSIHQDPQGARVGLALESMWGLSCPVVGRDRAALAAEFARTIMVHRSQWEALVLSGLAPEDPFLGYFADALVEHAHLRYADRALRVVASLEGGFDGYLARRSSPFRRGLRRASQKAEQAGLELVEVRADDRRSAEEIYERCVAVERESHKGRKLDGLLGSSMQEFYRDMSLRLSDREAMRVRFARLDDRDVGFLLGADWERSYRALQCSYDAKYSELSIGKLLQQAQIRALCEEGVLRYDLGSDVPYKRSWGESVETGLRLLVIR